MPMGVKPIGFRVLVEKLENRTYGQIQLPDDAKEAVFTRFKVVTVGTPKIGGDGQEIPIPVEVGDEVMFNTQRAIACGPAGFFDGRTLVIVECDGIVATFKGEPSPPPRKIVQASVVPEPVLTH